METSLTTTPTDIYDAIWNNLFNNFDRDKTINIRLQGETNAHTRSLSVFYNNKAIITVPIAQDTETKQSGQDIYIPVTFVWSAPGKTDVALTMHSTGGGLQIDGIIAEPNFRSAFIPAHAQTSKQYTAGLFSNLSKENKELDFIQALQRQFPSLKTVSVEIEAGAAALFVSVPWLSRKLPLVLYSNAASNLASILLNIAASANGVVLVDEIETGFYHTRYTQVWKQIFDFANDFQVQIFASTHSAECLQAAARFFKNCPHEFSLIRVFQENGPSSATAIDGQQALDLINAGLEVRI